MNNEDSDDWLPSMNYVQRVLEEDGPLSAAEIAEETGYSKSTVYLALRELQAEDVVETRPNYSDARKAVYVMAD